MTNTDITTRTYAEVRAAGLAFDKAGDTHEAQPMLRAARVIDRAREVAASPSDFTAKAREFAARVIATVSEHAESSTWDTSRALLPFIQESRDIENAREWWA